MVPDGSGEPHMELLLKDACEYDFKHFDKCCQCNCSMKTLFIEGTGIDSLDILSLSIWSETQQRQIAKGNYVVVNGQIDLTELISEEVFTRHQITFTIHNPDDLPEDVVFRVGGLCIAGNIDGGGFE